MDREMSCRIRVLGELSPAWSIWFDGLTVSPEPDGSTVLMGNLPDQAALHGFLAQIRDLGLTLVSVDVFDSRDETGSSRPVRG
jgi:hypothetical protein